MRPFTKPDDVHGMLAAKGILTSEVAPPAAAWLPVIRSTLCCPAFRVKIDLDKLQMYCKGCGCKKGKDFCFDGTSG